MVPSIHGKSQLGVGCVCVCIIPAMGEQTQKDAWGLLIGQSSLISEVQAPVRDPVSRKVVDF